MYSAMNWTLAAWNVTKLMSGATLYYSSDFIIGNNMIVKLHSSAGSTFPQLIYNTTFRQVGRFYAFINSSNVIKGERSRRCVLENFIDVGDPVNGKLVLLLVFDVKLTSFTYVYYPRHKNYVNSSAQVHFIIHYSETRQNKNIFEKVGFLSYFE